jgi:hypothetical protein
MARAVAAAHRRAPFDLALFPGDNIYDCGPDASISGADACRFDADGNTVAVGFNAPADPSFARHEEPLAPLAGLGLYLALGNHDVGAEGGCRLGGDPAAAARLKACLEVAHVSRVWTMPGRHYLLDRGPARFIVVDSNLAKGDYGGFTIDGEVAFVAEAAKGCDDRLCFLVGHHPPVTAGGHRSDATPDYLARMERLIQAGGGRIRAYLGGHDHDLQHLRTPSGLDVFVSGNGARGRSHEKFAEVSIPGAKLFFGSVHWGYGVLEIHPDGWSYRFEGDDGAPLYCCASQGAGRCEPVSCRPIAPLRLP